MKAQDLAISYGRSIRSVSGSNPPADRQLQQDDLGICLISLI